MAIVSDTRMADMTEADLHLINADADADARELPGRLMNAVAELERFQGSLKVSRLEHSLQSATRASRAGKDREYVAAALLHDIGDALAPHSHGEMVAAVLRPFVSERVCWIVHDDCVEFFRPVVEDVFRQPRHTADDPASVGS
jgi:predicted HD phosphohydrolase